MENKLNSKELLLIFLLGIAVYFNSFWVNFIWDDSALISNNYLIRSFTNIPKIFSTNLSYQRDIFYRPLQNFTYTIDFFLYKFNYRGYHLSNILLHIFVVILSFRLLFILTQNKILSNFTSLLYLVCPLWVESVTYISGRADILMAIFIFLSFISPILSFIAHHVFKFANIGISNFLDNIPAPFIWSECSCVMKIALMFSGALFIIPSLSIICLHDIPASIKTEFLPSPT